MTTELINKYRPQTFEEVIGQSAICKSIQNALRKQQGRSFLLSGPSGTGKTTIGRLIAKQVGCKAFDLIEVDGASTTGIDAMRELMSHLHYKSIGDSPRVVIVDECHALSSQAVKATLKILEEPPANIYWVLCTTELSKVPKEIRTRCLDYSLKAVSRSDLIGLIKKVAKKEQFPIRRSSSAVEMVAELAEGSPRQVLSILAQCGHLKDEEEIQALCSSGITSSAEAIDLCRLLMKGAPWRQLCTCIAKIDTPPESVRIIVLRYMASVLSRGKSPERVLAIVEEFSQPFLDREGNAPLFLACGRLCFN